MHLTILSNEENMLLNTIKSASQIINDIKCTNVSASNVIDEYLRRAKNNGAKLNAIVTLCDDCARKEAKEIDLRKKEFLDKPLLGLPITVKDQFMVKNTPTTMGCSNRWEPTTKEGPLIKRLREAGAIIIAKSSLPQLLVSHECHHAALGHAINPFNENRTTGGSSGGEAALVASGISPLGIAGDMGGSIRIPAHCCGVFGLKPTEMRFPIGDTPLLEGAMDNLLGFEGFFVQPGPLARTVDDLNLFMNATLAKPFKSQCQSPPVPWSSIEQTNPRSLKVGVITQSGILKPSPAILRAIKESSEVLRNAGLQVVPFNVPNPFHAIELYISLLGADGGKWLKKSLKGDKPISDISSFLKNASFPKVLRPIFSSLLNMMGQKTISQFIRLGGSLNVSDYWKYTGRRSMYRQTFINEMDKANVDILIAPPYSLPAPIINSNSSGVGTIASLESALFNLTGMPAGVVPVTRVKKEEESQRPNSKDIVECGAQLHERNSAGLPVGVQIIGRHWEEKQVLSIMALLEAAFKDKEDYPLNQNHTF